MATVDVVHWNPKRNVFPKYLGRVLPLQRRVNNFGDLVGPLIVSRLLEQAGVRNEEGDVTSARLLTVGSILHLARDGDVVWGTGRNGKVPEEKCKFEHLDVRAVRGPLTREFLLKRDIDVPSLYGDPGLLLPTVLPVLVEWRSRPAYDVTCVPNLNDYGRTRRACRPLNPRWPLQVCLERIARSRFVAGSSLHGLIIAEALGIPARGIKSAMEPEYKYADYYLGTGRGDFKLASSLAEAISLGGEPAPRYCAKSLLAAFPFDLWKVAATASSPRGKPPSGD